MSDVNERNTIKFAYYLDGWDYESGRKGYLREQARKVAPLEYLPEMKGHIFCPECCAPLFRSPEDKDYASNGKAAFFAHGRGVQADCSLRVKQGQGKRYATEEEAKQAIQDGELVVVDSFMKDKPEPPQLDGPLVYDWEPNEDQNGPLTAQAIGRHNGEEFKLPSRVTTIRGLCRSFDDNLHRYFLLPGQNAARTLQDQLIQVANVAETCDVPRLYVGRIVSSTNMGSKPSNIRQTFLSFPSKPGCKDFCLKATDEASKEHGIDNDSVGRIVIAYGKVTESGIGLCIAKLGWGEFALLPKKYDYLFDDI